MKLSKDQKSRLIAGRKESVALLARIDAIYEAFHQEFGLDENDSLRIGLLNDYLVGEKVTLKKLEEKL